MSKNSKVCIKVSGEEFFSILYYSKIQECFESLEFVERKKKFKSNDDIEIFKIILNKLQEYFLGRYTVSLVGFKGGCTRGLVKQVCLGSNSTNRIISLGYVEVIPVRYVGVVPGFLSEYIVSFFNNSLEKIMTIIAE